jgi:hypothetical protein
MYHQQAYSLKCNSVNGEVCRVSNDFSSRKQYNFSAGGECTKGRSSTHLLASVCLNVYTIDQYRQQGAQMSEQ